VGCLLLMEVSNPSMHLIQMMKEVGLADTRLALANQARAELPQAPQPAHTPQLLFALLFFVCRLCVGPLVVAATLRSPTTPLVVKAGGAGILLVSLVWFRKVRIGEAHCAAAR